MNVLPWNCRVIRTSDNPTIPYLFWLVSDLSPNLFVLNKKQSDVSYVHRLLSSTRPTTVCRMDVAGSRGGLVVFCLGPYEMLLVSKTILNHFEGIYIVIRVIQLCMTTFSWMKILI